MTKKTNLTRLDKDIQEMIDKELEWLKREFNMKKVTRSDALRSILSKKKEEKRNDGFF